MLTRTLTASSLPLALAASLLLAGTAAQAQSSTLLGHPVPVSSTARTVQIGPDTQTVRVDRFDTVQFETPQGRFAVRFDGSVNHGSLQTLAPAGVLTHDVRVRVLPDGGDEYQ